MIVMATGTGTRISVTGIQRKDIRTGGRPSFLI